VPIPRRRAAPGTRDASRGTCGGSRGPRGPSRRGGSSAAGPAGGRARSASHAKMAQRLANVTGVRRTGALCQQSRSVA